ncbi:MAG: DUF427 domain-containing protein [Kordiimonas sp.]
MQNQTTTNPAPGFIKYPTHKMVLGEANTEAKATVGNIVIASSKTAIIVSEADYPDAVYFPRKDVDMSKLVSSDTSSFCPFKGTANYWKLPPPLTKDAENIDICWSYSEPFDEAAAIGAYIAFYPNHVAVIYCQ